MLLKSLKEKLSAHCLAECFKVGKTQISELLKKKKKKEEIRKMWVLKQAKSTKWL